ncbi:polyketide synthase [Aspergillus karnatakaensis]|uniref:type I polyketide synthase n=1 Tax=Aspergillus karnatakaensis TaxID=1810916 RepID=UPI003CCE4915
MVTATHLNGATPSLSGDVHGNGVAVNGNSNASLDGVHIPSLNGNGHLNGGTNGVNGHVNGHANGTTNGITNGHTTTTQDLPIGNIADVPIAIVGMSCRFPGEATSPERLWELCVNARSAWSEVPGDRWNKEAFYHPDGARTGTTNVRGGHFLTQDIAHFDAPFFNVSAVEAKAMDPQLRLQLEVCYEALENAGIPLDQIAGTKTAVFSGIFTRDYTEAMLRDIETLPSYYVTGTGTAMLANRVSYFFDLKGPSLTVDTGCSTSLVALHLACQSIRSGESEAALVGGSNVILNPDLPIALSNMGFLSPEGKSYAFDHRAAGYGRGEGAACIVIKPLDKAIRDGDHVFSVIRQTAINSDGKTDGITQPSAVAHERLIRYAYGQAKLDPFETDYIEAHGTGTQAGDPLELKAVGKVFGKTRTEKNPVYVGSVKTNVGHLEAASGLAGVIKASLALQKGVIPPNINFEKVNAKIPLDEYNIRVPLAPTPWPARAGGPPRASVNSLGYGGTNAHVILERAGALVPRPYSSGSTNGASDTKEQWRLFPFSAKDEDSLYEIMSNVSSFVKSQETVDSHFLENLAYTLGQRRSAFRWTQAVTANSAESLIKSLDERKPASTRRRPAEPPRIGFVFTGQGAQWYAMGRELLDAYPVFRKSIRRAEDFLATQGCPWSIVEELNRDAETTRVNEATVGQPLCTAIQIALVDLLASWGIKPTAVTGHSSGEIASAYAAGAWSLEAAMMSSYHRGAMAKQSAKLIGGRGGMIAVGLSRAEANEYISRLTAGKVVVACVNSPSNVTVSGDLDAIDELQAQLDADGVFGRKLKVDTAYHSHHMVMAMDGYLDKLTDMETNQGELSDVMFVSSVTGGVVRNGKELGPSYSVKNAVQPVLFSDALECLCRGGAAPEEQEIKAFVDVLIEVGPHGALASPIRQILKSPSLKDMNIPYVSCLMRKQDARESMLNVASSLWLKGSQLDLAAINSPSGSDLVRVIPDLPSYPWSHKTRYWHEPRANRLQRQREHARHDLLGVLSPGQNPAVLTWRHFVRLSDQPWVKDHVVDSNILYPAAGFIAMAIEGVAQTHESSASETAGYRVHEMKIGKALVVPDTADGVEVQLSLVPCKDQLPKAQHSYDFKILSANETDDEWTEHCSGRIGLEAKPVASETNWKSSQIDSSAAKLFAEGEAACAGSIEPKPYYEGVQQLGISYGETFQNLVNIQHGTKRSLTTVSIRDTAAVMPSQLEQPHIIHPTTLDTIFQSIYPALAEDGIQQKSIMVPTFVKSLFVSGEISNVPGSTLRVSTIAEGNPSNGAKASSTSVQGGDGRYVPVVEIEELSLSSLGTSVQEIKDEDSSNLCFNVTFERDVSFMRRGDFADLSETTMDESELKLASDLQQACFYLVKRALDELTDADKANLEGHRVSMFNWMTAQLELAEQDSHPDLRDSAWRKATLEEQDSLIARVESESVNGEMCVRVGQNLLPILRKDVEPLEVMMEGGLLHKYYEHALGMKRIYTHAASLLRLLGHKNPGATILEIGGGTAGCTLPALQALTGEDGIPRFAHYDFTDISSGFFEKAKDKLSAWDDRLGFKKFDVESDPASQSVECGKYDLVIACNVLHATVNMDRTMANVKKLLKPEGQLLIVEGTRDTLDVSLTFGVLPGWWLGEEEERRLSPKLTLTAWDDLLKRNGFTGQDALMLDAPKEQDHVYSVFLSNRIPDTKVKEYPPAVIVLGKEQQPEKWVSQLASSIEAVTGQLPVVASLHGDAELSGKLYIVVAEMEKPILAHLSEEDFSSLRKLLTTAKGVLWVTRGGTIDCSTPDAAMITGLLRTLRTENAGIRYATLDLEMGSASPYTTESTSTISKIVEATFDSNTESANIDFEYSERNGQIYVPRVLPDPGANKALLETNGEPTVEDQPFYQEGRPLRMETGTAGLLDTLRFVDDFERNEPLPADFVEVEPKAFGLNFRDVMIAMGQLNETIMGYECSGVISRVGSNVTHLKVGDRVAAMMRGHYANYIRLLGIAVAKIPDEMTFEEAATMPMVFSTAYFSLYDTAHLQKGESVLIHAAAGGVGQAAIMLAQLVGAEIYATVGSREKAQLLMDNYGIPEDHIFSSRNASFVDEIMAATGGKGVDVALNSLSGQLLSATWKCMAMFGRFVEIGKRDIEINTRLEMGGFQGNVSFSAIDLTYMGRFRPAHLLSILENCMQLASEGKIRAVHPVTVFPISEVERAFRFMQAGKHTGKVVIKPNPSDVIKAISRRPENLLRDDSSYIIVGGLGGIGQSLARWMLKQGAKNLIILSRSGSNHPRAGELAEDLAQAGCKVLMPECDISNADAVTRAIDDAAVALPPIRGIVQGAMVLNDCVFEHMSYQQYLNAVYPKVQGTWNLHQSLLEQPLDFFVMLSSAVGVVGNSSQTNYAAGSSFLDALAKHRRSNGLPALSLDLGIIESVGYVSENDGVRERLNRMGHETISEERMIGLIQLAIADGLHNKQPSQIVTGLTTKVPDAAWIQAPIFSVLRQARSGASAAQGGAGGSAQQASLQELLRTTVKSLPDAVAVIRDAMIGKLAKNLMVSDADIDPEQPVSACGVDSLVAVELRNWLLGQTGSEVSVIDVLQSKSLLILSENVAKKSPVVAKSIGLEEKK